jgi:hypothetical protein
VHFLRQHRFALLFLALLVFCSVMVILQLETKRKTRVNKHTELRENMILLQTGGYTNEADKLYLRLLRDLDKLTNKELLEDWQRTVILVDPGANQPSNAVWRYYWTVRNQMESRAEGSIERARRMAAEEE